MKLHGLLVTLLVLATTASAESISSYRTYNFGNRVLTVDDSLDTLLKIAGEPDRIKPQLDRYGNTHSERYEYDVNGKIVSVWVTGRKVASIDEVRP